MPRPTTTALRKRAKPSRRKTAKRITRQSNQSARLFAGIDRSRLSPTAISKMNAIIQSDSARLASNAVPTRGLIETVRRIAERVGPPSPTVSREVMQRIRLAQIGASLPRYTDNLGITKPPTQRVTRMPSKAVKGRAKLVTRRSPTKTSRPTSRNFSRF